MPVTRTGKPEHGHLGLSDLDVQTAKEVFPQLPEDVREQIERQARGRPRKAIRMTLRAARMRGLAEGVGNA